METALGLINVDSIMELPWILKGPGLALIALFVLRAIRCVFSLRLITMVISLIYAFVIAVILSQGGSAIVQMLGLEEEPQVQSSFQHLLDDGNPHLT